LAGEPMKFNAKLLRLPGFGCHGPDNGRLLNNK
jgi:hypothetical protein